MAKVSEQNCQQKVLMQRDVDVSWHAQPLLNDGLDFAIRVKSPQVHIGGVLGLVVSSSAGSDQIKDGSYSLSVPLDHKG